MSAQSFRKKVVTGVVALVRDEAAALRKIGRWAAGLRYLGALAGALACLAAWHLGAWPGLLIALAAGAGGIALGASLMFDASREQWPVMKTLIDRAALERAAKESGIAAQ